MLNITQITPPRVAMIDERTGAVTREWYRFFYNLYYATGGTTGGATPVERGGTGLTSLVKDGILYASSTNSFAIGKDLTFDGTNFATTGAVDAGASVTAGTTVNAGESVNAGTSVNAVDDVNAGKNVNAGIDVNAINDVTAGRDVTATRNVNLNGRIASPTYIDMGNGDAVTLAAARMWYTPTTGAWNLGMGNGNITQQVGEEFYRYGKASSAISDTNLQLVYKTGVVGASGVITFAPTIAGITDPDQIIGVSTESIATNGFGRVTTMGIVHGINTTGSVYGETWADNDDIWYNPVTGGLKIGRAHV